MTSFIHEFRLLKNNKTEKKRRKKNDTTHNCKGNTCLEKFQILRTVHCIHTHIRNIWREHTYICSMFEPNAKCHKRKFEILSSFIVFKYAHLLWSFFRSFPEMFFFYRKSRFFFSFIMFISFVIVTDFFFYFVSHKSWSEFHEMKWTFMFLFLFSLKERLKKAENGYNVFQAF